MYKIIIILLFTTSITIASVPMDFNLAPQERATDSFDKAMDRLNKMQKLWDSNFASEMAYHRFTIKQDEQEYFLKIAIPGFDKAQIKLEIQGRNLVLSTRDAESSSTEISSDLGELRHEWSLPSDADLEDITSSLKNGLLTIKIPKISPQTKISKEIPID